MSIDDYADRTTATIEPWRNMNGQQGGDPTQVAVVLVTITKMANSPLRFVAGADIVVAVERKPVIYLSESSLTANSHGTSLSTTCRHDQEQLQHRRPDGRRRAAPAGEVCWRFRVGNPMNACAALLDAWNAAALCEAGTHIMGRTAYEATASAWPLESGVYANVMNEIPKVVCSSTLTRADWAESRIASGKLAEDVADIKRWGDHSVRLATWLLRDDRGDRFCRGRRAWPRADIDAPSGTGAPSRGRVFDRLRPSLGANRTGRYRVADSDAYVS